MLPTEQDTSAGGEVERNLQLLQRFIEHLRSHDKSQQTISSYSSDLKLFGKWFHEINREELTRQSITPIDLREYKRYLLQHQGFSQLQSTEDLPAYRPSASEHKTRGSPTAIPLMRFAWFQR